MDDSQVSSKRRKQGSPAYTGAGNIDAAVTETPTNENLWLEWDSKNSSHKPQSIKAVRVWRRLSTKRKMSSPSGRSRKSKPSLHLDTIVSMVLAVGNAHSFRALKGAMMFFQQRQTTWSTDLFSDDPKILVSYMTTLETAGNLDSYLRRFALARLAKLYLDTTANRG